MTDRQVMRQLVMEHRGLWDRLAILMDQLAVLANAADRSLYAMYRQLAQPTATGPADPGAMPTLAEWQGMAPRALLGILNRWTPAPTPAVTPPPAPRVPRPTIVCLCGSTRFYAAFQEANYRETMAGRIVLSVGHYPHSPGEAHGESAGCTADQKVALDELHKRKIDIADEVLVLNVGGYIGESTRSEIEYATAHGKPVRYLEGG